jgi:hypothetical protein
MSTVSPPPPPPVPPQPLQAPQTAPSPSAAREVSGPATGLLITAILGAFWAFVVFFFKLLGLSLRTMMADSAEEQFSHWISGGFGVTFIVVALLVAGFLIYASLEMRKLSQWGLAVGASVVAMLPCISPCCLLGLPVGIWSLVVLTKPEIKAAFH